MRNRIMLAVLFFLLVCGSVQAQSQVEWVPFGPISFFDSHSFGDGRVAIATEGYLLWSNDDGKTFSPQFFPGNPALRTIAFVDDQFGYVAGSNGSIYRTSDAGNAWVTLNSPATSVIMDLAVPSPNTIFVLDYWGKLYVSSSSGESWNRVEVSDSLGAPFVWNGTRLLVTGSAGTIYSIDPADLDIKVISTPHILRVNAFDAIGDTMFASAGQTIARSFDLGKTWALSEDVPGGNVQVLKILSGQNVAAFIDGPLRFFSTDMGKSWGSSEFSTVVEKFAFALKRFGWEGEDGWSRFIGWFGSVYAIAPNGVDYKVEHQCFPQLPFQSVFIRQKPNSPQEWRGTAEFYSSFLISSDNGWSWVGRDDPYLSRRALGLFFVDTVAVILPSASGKKWSPAHSTGDDGRTWTRLYGTPRDSAYFMQDLVVHDGILELPTYVHIFRSYDGGRTWPDTLYYEDPLPEEATLRGGIVDASFFGRDTIYLRLKHPSQSGFTPNTFVRTTDGGRSWSPWLSLGAGAFYAMAFATPSNGFIVTDGGLLGTLDGGLRWKYKSLGDGEEQLREIAFNSNGSVGVIAGYAGSIYHTLDSGTTWTRDSALYGGRASKNDFSSVQFINDSTVVIQSNSGFFRRSFDLPQPKSIVESKKFEAYFYAFVYPNPTTENRLSVYLHGLHAVSNKASLGYDIQDSWGRTVIGNSTFGVHSSEVAVTKEINLEGLTSGIYYLRVSCTDGMRVLPFSVVK